MISIKKNLNNKNFINFYKKNLIQFTAKKKYNPKTYKKITNEEACFNGYLIFSKFLLNNKKSMTYKNRTPFKNKRFIIDKIFNNKSHTSY